MVFLFLCVQVVPAQRTGSGAEMPSYPSAPADFLCCGFLLDFSWLFEKLVFSTLSQAEHLEMQSLVPPGGP